MNKIKHFFGRCKYPKDFDDYLNKLRINTPGKIIDISDEVLHWDTYHESAIKIIEQEKVVKKQRNCRHKFLPISRPNMVWIRTGYDTHQWDQRGDIHLQKCSKCGQEIK